MSTLFVTHHVKDYSIWKPIFDQDDSDRREHGMRLLSLYQGEQDPNEISMLFEVDDLHEVEDIMGSDEMKTKMMEAGVDSDLKMMVLNKVA